MPGWTDLNEKSIRAHLSTKTFTWIRDSPLANRAGEGCHAPCFRRPMHWRPVRLPGACWVLSLLTFLSHKNGRNGMRTSMPLLPMSGISISSLCELHYDECLGTVDQPS